MKKRLSIISVCLSCMLSFSTAQAAIYKSVDADGHITYSNVPINGAVKLNLEPLAPPKGAGPAKRPSQTKTPDNFPRVDAQTQNQRDDKRKAILQQELDAEKESLATAKQAYVDGAATPEVYSRKGANGKSQTFRNVPKFEEKMRTLQAEVDAHQRNVEMLEKEIVSVK